MASFGIQNMLETADGTLRITMTDNEYTMPGELGFVYQVPRHRPLVNKTVVW